MIRVFCAAVLLLLSSLQLSAAAAESAPSAAEQWVKAIANDDVALIRQLLDKAAATDVRVLTAPNGKTALMVASKKGDLSLVRDLINQGANINTVTHTGGNAFMFSVLGNHLDVAQWLAKHNANIAAAGSNGWSAMTIAAAMGHSEILAWLSKQNAPLDQPDVYRFTPLMRAVDNGHLIAVRLLLATGDVDVNAQDEWDNTAMHFVMANKDEAMLVLLLEHGASMTSLNRSGITPEAMSQEWPEARPIIARFR